MNHAQLGASSETFWGHLQSIYWVRTSSWNSFIVLKRCLIFLPLFNCFTHKLGGVGRTKISDQKNDLKKTNTNITPRIRHFWKPSDTTLDAVKEATGFEFQVADPLKTMHLGVRQIEGLVGGLVGDRGYDPIFN